MKPKVGTYYRTAGGEQVGPMRKGYWSAAPFGAKVVGSRCNHLCLYDEDGRAHMGRNYDLVAEWGDEPEAQPAGPVRTITRKEIVPGVYGEVTVDDDGDVRVGYMHDAATIRAAIATLTEIADAMEGGAE